MLLITRDLLFATDENICNIFKIINPVCNEEQWSDFLNDKNSTNFWRLMSVHISCLLQEELNEKKEPAVYFKKKNRFYFIDDFIADFSHSIAELWRETNNNPAPKSSKKNNKMLG